MVKVSLSSKSWHLHFRIRILMPLEATTSSPLIIILPWYLVVPSSWQTSTTIVEFYEPIICPRVQTTFPKNSFLVSSSSKISKIKVCLISKWKSRVMEVTKSGLRLSLMTSVHPNTVELTLCPSCF